MVWHQAIGPDRHAGFAASFGHQIQIGLIVVVDEKSLLPAVAPLGQMVGHPGHDHVREPCHGVRIARAVK